MSQSGLSVVMMGATGAVGSEVVRALLDHHGLQKLTLLGRRRVDDWDRDGVIQPIIDIFEPDSYRERLAGHSIAVCTLGVGQPSTMSKQEFVRIDKQAVLDFAAQCKASGVGQFHLLSSVGAEAKSASFYLRTKGELQEELKALAFDRLCLYQPSMILTPTNRYGLMQGLTLALWPSLSHLMVGPLTKFRGIRVEKLGRAIAHNAVRKSTGVDVLQWSDFVALADRPG